MTNIVKVVNVSDSTIHISNINTVLRKNGVVTLSENSINSNPEIMGAISAGLLEVRPIGDKIEAVVKDAVPEDVPEVAEEPKADDGETVFFSEADKNAEPVSESSFIKVKEGVFKIDPATAEPVQDVVDEGDESSRKEIVDGVEIINPVKERTRKINGVEIVINSEKGDDEYDEAFIDSNI